MSLQITRSDIRIAGGVLLTALIMIFPILIKILAVLLIAVTATVVTGIGLLAILSMEMCPLVHEDIAASRIIEFEAPGTGSANFIVSMFVSLILAISSLLIAGIFTSFAVLSMAVTGTITFVVSATTFFYFFN